MGNDLAAAQIGQARRMESLVQIHVTMQANFAAEEKAKEVEQQGGKGCSAMAWR